MKNTCYQSSKMELFLTDYLIIRQKSMFIESSHSNGMNAYIAFSLVDITINGLKYDSVPQTVPPQGE